MDNLFLTNRKKLKNDGTIMIDSRDSFIQSKDFVKIENTLKKIPKEFVTIGDAGEKNYVHVSRLMTDIKKPIIVNKRFSKIVIDLLNKKYKSHFEQITNHKKLFIRRAQVNVMFKNSFVGYHLDIDSNPDYLYAVILQLGSNFTGGLYVVYKKGKKPKKFKPNYKSIIISDCKIPHEVSKVKSGKRISFVFFLSKNFKANKRLKS
ncbi:MAG: 2OG-Fe(II) oxygenase [Pseudomonadota bacterium]|nr:2OG-Fe(II) oxygenase [Pseudomonadota bacterium]